MSDAEAAEVRARQHDEDAVEPPLPCVACADEERER
jgi:hypothetical protein